MTEFNVAFRVCRDLLVVVNNAQHLKTFQAPPKIASREIALFRVGVAWLSLLKWST